MKPVPQPLGRVLFLIWEEFDRLPPCVTRGRCDTQGERTAHDLDFTSAVHSGPATGCRRTTCDHSRIWLHRIGAPSSGGWYVPP